MCWIEVVDIWARSDARFGCSESGSAPRPHLSNHCMKETLLTAVGYHHLCNNINRKCCGEQRDNTGCSINRTLSGEWLKREHCELTHSCVCGAESLRSAAVDLNCCLTPLSNQTDCSLWFLLLTKTMTPLTALHSKASLVRLLFLQCNFLSECSFPQWADKAARKEPKESEMTVKLLLVRACAQLCNKERVECWDFKINHPKIKSPFAQPQQARKSWMLDSLRLPEFLTKSRSSCPHSHSCIFTHRQCWGGRFARSFCCGHGGQMSAGVCFQEELSCLELNSERFEKNNLFSSNTPKKLPIHLTVERQKIIPQINIKHQP